MKGSKLKTFLGCFAFTSWILFFYVELFSGKSLEEKLDILMKLSKELGIKIEKG